MTTATTAPIARMIVEVHRSLQTKRQGALCDHRRFEGHWTLGVPKSRALFEATFFAGLRKAGMPEE